MKNNIPFNFWIYILEVKNGNLYTGYTKNLDKRLEQHFSKTGGCKFTRNFRPVQLKRCWKIVGTYSDVMSLENYIKKQPREKKLKLIAHPKLLKDLFSSYKKTGILIRQCRKKYPVL